MLTDLRNRDQCYKTFWAVIYGHHDAQHNDIQNYDVQYNDTQHNDILHNVLSAISQKKIRLL
jgi:hypothetical protein